MKSASLSFNDQNKYSQNRPPVQTPTGENLKAVKMLAARLCLRIIETHYGLTVAEIRCKYQNGTNEVYAALYKLTQGHSRQRVKDAANRLLSELDHQPHNH